jgi:hypothetical protein
LDSFVIFIILYIILIVFDLIPLIKKKNKKALYVSVPIYLLTITVNSMSSLGFPFVSLGPLLQKLIASIFHL